MKKCVLFLMLVILVGCQSKTSPSETKSIELRLADEGYVSGYTRVMLERNSKFVYVSPEVVFENKDIKSIDMGPYFVGYAIHIEFSDKEKLFDVTSKNINRKLAILIDGAAITAPTIQAPIRDGKVMITGYYSKVEAEKLVEYLVH